MQPPRHVHRIDSLDALRGLAALLVVTYHCAMAVPGLHDRIAATIVLKPLVLGPSAVLVFFALSGFVLYLAFDAKDGFAYLPYIVKRIARIYPPLVVAILTSALLYRVIAPQPVPALSDWFNQFSWHDYPTLTVILGHLALLDGARFQGLDNVVWSLVHEVRISIVFPVIALAVRRNWWATCLVCLGITLIARRYDTLLAGWPLDLPATLQYVFLFAGGAALACRQDTIRRWAEGKIGGRLCIVMLLGGLVLVMQLFTQSAIATALGALALVAGCFAHPPTRRLLAIPPLIWLGRVSYSLYLLHLLVMLALVHGLGGRVPIVVLVALVLPVSLLLAEPAYRLVERPSIALGRRLARRLERHAPAATSTQRA